MKPSPGRHLTLASPRTAPFGARPGTLSTRWQGRMVVEAHGVQPKNPRAHHRASADSLRSAAIAAEPQVVGSLKDLKE
jgi:hypothetical protein